MTNGLETDVLIIGCGIAGATTALELARAGFQIMVITRTADPHESNTYYAQGGIIYQGEADSPELLVEDVLRAGAGYSDRAAVTILAEQGPPLVQDLLLERVHVPFDRNGGNKLSLAREGGHSVPRIIHAADATGRVIQTAILQALSAHPNVTLLTGYTALDLLTSDPGLPSDSPRCRGAYLLNQAEARVATCLARYTVLATGGLGQVYSRTTNPAGARGDGVAMAVRAGALVKEMEFVQFHPTAFYQPGAPSFLISEAVRGAGARLVNERGEPFMQKYAPDWQDLAPRDIVARSIYQEMTTRHTSNVYLDLRTYIPRPTILNHFPNIYEKCLAYGVDITRDLAPVAPAAHYACGGVAVDAWGQTRLERLYAVGEVACTGLHGANRLASTSLLEGVVWGYRAATHIRSHTNGRPDPDPSDIRPYAQDHGTTSPDPARLDRYSRAIRELMWAHVGLRRTTAGLTEALYQLGDWQAGITRLYQTSRPTDELIGLCNLVEVARLISAAALENEAAVGCHYRE
ncbi:MAG: L-aspartate oxidase [Chloroflexota bacterium]